MPTLGAPLDLAKYEARNLRAHVLGAAPSSPVTGQLYYNSGDNTLYVWDGTQWYTTRGSTPADASTSVKGIVQLAGDLAGTATSPQIAAGVIVDADVNGAAAIAESKLNLATDAAAGTGSRRTLGTGATQACAGNDSRLSDSRTPSGAASGDLSGTYPSPQIANGVIVDTDVNAANKDGSAAVPSMRTLGTGAQQAMAGNTRLDTIAAPTGSVGLNNQKLTNVAEPTASSDAATKNYVDTAAQGLDAKISVKAATTANITLSGTQTVDGIALVANDRILVKDQTTTNQNGIYVVAAGAWSRATDSDTWAELVASYTFVEQGTVNADSGWVCTVDQGGTLGTTAVTWTQFSGAGQITAGNGLTKTGNTLDVGGSSTITVAADTISVTAGSIGANEIATGGVDLTTTDVTGTLPLTKGGTGQTTAKAARETGLGAAGYYNNNATHGAGTTIVITQATHGLRASRAILVQVQDNATGNVEIPDISVAASGDVTLTYGASVSANSKLVTLVG